MIVAIMQPYFFPYLGYFQLMSACDTFVIFDNVQYIRRGWVNRNRILVNGRPQWLTMPVADASHRLPINRREYLLDDRLAQRVRRRIVGAYRNAPFFERTLALVDEILACRKTNVAVFNTNLVRRVGRELGVQPPVRLASELPERGSFAGQDLVIDICRQFGGSAYINPIGGVGLYDPELFSRRSLALHFLHPYLPAYPQFGETPVTSLSILDVLMFNDCEAIGRMLQGYRVAPGGQGPSLPGGPRQPVA